MTDVETPTEGGEAPEAELQDGAPGGDLASEVQKWKDLARKNDQHNKNHRQLLAETRKELDDIRRQSMSEQERAVAEAVDGARKSTIVEMAGRLVDAEVRAAAAGRNVDVDALLEGLNQSRFITESGEPDRDAVMAWVDRVAPAAQEPTTQPGWPDLGQGTRTPALPLNGDPLLNALKGKLGIG